MNNNYRAGGKYDQILEQLIADRGATEDNAVLIKEMMTTALKLIDEKVGRGDLKVINTALKEMRYSEKIFAPYKGHRKISVFGSARTKKDAPEYEMAVEFSRQMAAKDFMVITGAASGIMEAANEGAGREKSFGLNIRLPFEQEPNIHVNHDEKLMTFKYFFTRKLAFVKHTDAIALFPGGFGTLDEGFEAMTLIQTGKSDMVPLVLLQPKGRPYWEHWLTFVKKSLVDPGYVSPADMGFFKLCETVEEGVEEIVQYYRNFHSSRYVGDSFVIRVHRAPDELIDHLNKDYKIVLRPGGSFAKSAALPEEADEPTVLKYERIILPFNRSDHGNYRAIIDTINRY